MGSYVYGRTSQIKTVKRNDGGTIEINLAKFLFKPSYSLWDDNKAREDALAARYDRRWEGEDLPQFMITADSFASYDEHAVYDTTARDGDQLGSTFWDSGNYGRVVGEIKKVGGRWVFFPEAEPVRITLPTDPSVKAQINIEEVARILKPENRHLIPTLAATEFGSGLIFRNAHTTMSSFDAVVNLEADGEKYAYARISKNAPTRIIWAFN